MIKPPSVQNEYTLIYSGDPALNLPEDEAERKRVLDQARETGNWEPLLGGEPPTLFRIRPLFGDTLNWWDGERGRLQLGGLEAAALALRLTLRKVENLPGVKVELQKERGQLMVKPETIAALYEACGDEAQLVIQELSAFVIERAAAALRPKQLRGSGS